MGRRDDRFLDDERADVALQRLLARAGEPSQVSPPADLIVRAARRLPAAPPSLAARRIRRRQTVRLALIVVICGLVALVGLASLLDVLAGHDQLARLFGSGGSGISRVVLTLQLLVKPALRAIGAVGVPLLIVGSVAIAVAAWLWWWLLRRTPTYTVLEQAS
jgi:hypothetical protein